MLVRRLRRRYQSAVRPMNQSRSSCSLAAEDSFAFSSVCTTTALGSCRSRSPRGEAPHRGQATRGVSCTGCLTCLHYRQSLPASEVAHALAPRNDDDRRLGWLSGISLQKDLQTNVYHDGPDGQSQARATQAASRRLPPVQAPQAVVGEEGRAQTRATRRDAARDARCARRAVFVGSRSLSSWAPASALGQGQPRRVHAHGVCATYGPLHFFGRCAKPAAGASTVAVRP